MATSPPLAQSGVIPVPTMSTQGLVYDSANKFDMLMAHLFAADYNQTQLYPGRVSSLANAIEKGAGDRVRSEESLQQLFNDYLGRYYVSVNTEVVITEINDSSSQLDFQINISLTEKRQQAQYNMLIRTARKQLQEIIKLNNYG
jgi:hypothetical protein